MSAITSDCASGPRRPAVVLVLGLALALVLTAATGRPARAAGAIEVGQPAPALVARSFSGETIDLAALRGKVVVLNFWASWCGPCRAEMPLLEALYREYRDRGVVVVGLSADDPHDRTDALKAAQGIGYTTGMLADALANGFGSPQVLPLTYIIGRSGEVSAVLRANGGPLSAGQLRRAVEDPLRPTQPSASSP